jgi:chorismate synthase
MTISKKMGAPSKYGEEYVRMAYVLCAETGLTDKKIASVFDVCEATINNWKHEYPDFLESIQRGKDDFNCEKAEDSLFKLVMGFHYTETTKEAKSVVIKNQDGAEKVM